MATATATAATTPPAASLAAAPVKGLTAGSSDSAATVEGAVEGTKHSSVTVMVLGPVTVISVGAHLC